LNSFANVKNDRDESRMASGRLFQVCGPAMANDGTPSAVWPILCWCRRKTMLNQSKRTTVRPVTAYAARGNSHYHLI